MKVSFLICTYSSISILNPMQISMNVKKIMEDVITIVTTMMEAMHALVVQAMS